MTNKIIEQVENDIFTTPIDFALKEVMKKFENSGDEYKQIIYEGLQRSKTMWEHIRINGLETIGMTYDQFCDQFKTKRNVVFLSDDEMLRFNKAMQLVEVMESWR